MYCVPVLPCQEPPPEVYNQNDGKPVVVYAQPNEIGNELAPCASPVPCAESPEVPYPIPVPVPAPAPCDLDEAQEYAASSDGELPVETLPQSDKPCKVETSTDVVQKPGETFVHQPSLIKIMQPPTQLTIYHAPLFVKPAPVIVNQGGKTITKLHTRKFLPSQTQVRPVFVRVIKPIEKKVFIDKPAPGPSCKTFATNPVLPNPCLQHGLPAGSLVESEVPEVQLDVSFCETTRLINCAIFRVLTKLILFVGFII